MARPSLSRAVPGEALKRTLVAGARAPAEFVLTRALRRLAARRPSAFDRLGPYRDAVYVLRPDNLPLAFALRPHPVHGDVRIVLSPARMSPTAEIRGSIACLLALFDGSLDADAAFFTRDLAVEGDVGAILALHNALEAADLSIADLIDAPALLAGPVVLGVRTLASLSPRILARAG